MSPDELNIVVETEQIDFSVDKAKDVKLIIDSPLDVVSILPPDDLNIIVETKEVKIEVDETQPDIELTLSSLPDIIVLPTTGLTGPPGPAGAEGPKGERGFPGMEGPQGIPGPVGADSTVPGPPGSTGPPGATGIQGIQGIPGVAGTAGTPGEKWFTGAGSPTVAPFPAPELTQTSSGTASGTAYQAPFPKPNSVGELVMCLVFAPAANNVPLNTPANWSLVGGFTSTVAIYCFTRFANQAMVDGTETTMPIVTGNGTNRTVYIWAARFGGSAHASTLPALALVNNNYDPPNLDPANWATEKTLWYAISCSSNNQAGSDPAGYTSVYVVPTNLVRIASKNLEAASENPATFSGAFDGGSGTLAVRPTANAGTFGNVGDWYLDSANGDYYEKTLAPTTWTLRGNLKGPTGSAAATYTHTQSTLSATWIITHNLGRFPSVTAIDTGDSVIIPDVHYDNANQVTLSFGASTSGKAYLN